MKKQSKEMLLIESSDKINVQGTEFRTNSAGKEYIVVKSRADTVVVLVDGKQKNALEYTEKNAAVRSMAISDNGIAIIGFESGGQVGIVKLVDFSSLIGPRVLDTRVWMLGFGNGVDITQNSMMAVIGSPNENAVYTYNISNKGTFIPQKKITNKKMETFGWKVALSESGNTLAVTAPKAMNDKDSKVGAVTLYRNRESFWKQLDEIAYGLEETRKLGLGGVAVNEQTGRIDVVDEKGDFTSFQVSLYLNRNSTKYCLFLSQTTLMNSTRKTAKIMRCQLEQMEICLMLNVGACPVSDHQIRREDNFS